MTNKLHSPVWNIADGLSYSGLCKWLVCRERFRLHYVEGLREDRVFDAPLEYGSLFHVCLESLAERGYKSSLQRGDWKKDLSAYQDELFAKYPADRDKIILWTKIAKRQFEHYMAHWKKEDANRQYLYQEYEFHHEYVLPNKHHITLHGYYDAVYEEDNAVILQENKTKGRFDEQLLNDTLAQNLQTMIYGVALRDQLAGNYPDGSLYNVIRRPGLRQTKKESTTDFLQRIDSDIASRPEHYFVRIPTALTSMDFDVFRREMLTPILFDFYIWWKSIENNPFDPWYIYDVYGRKKGRNPHHYRKPFGVYDSLASGFQGDFFELLARGSTYGLTRTDKLRNSGSRKESKSINKGKRSTKKKSKRTRTASRKTPNGIADSR